MGVVLLLKESVEQLPIFNGRTASPQQNQLFHRYQCDLQRGRIGLLFLQITPTLVARKQRQSVVQPLVRPRKAVKLHATKTREAHFLRCGSLFVGKLPLCGGHRAPANNLRFRVQFGVVGDGNDRPVRVDDAAWKPLPFHQPVGLLVPGWPRSSLIRTRISLSS